MSESREKETHQKELEKMFERLEEITVSASLMAAIVQVVEAGYDVRMNPETGTYEKEVA